MLLFLILTSVEYLGELERLVGYFERGGSNLMFTSHLTNRIIGGFVGGFFPSVIQYLYIIFPLITMGLISREMSSGTIKLLYSSPVRVVEIVLGKFFAMVCFSVVLMGLLCLTLVCFSISDTNPDYLRMVASVFGVFILICTFSAIGLFISSLTSYQIVAAMITLVVFVLLSSIGSFLQDVSVIRNIAHYLGIIDKSWALIRGFYNSRDIFYFLILISSFLALTVLKIMSSTESLSFSKKILRYGTVISLALLVGFITSRPQLNVYADITRDDLYTITQPTQQTLAKLNEGPLEITFYGNLFNNYTRFTPDLQNRIIAAVWEPYIRFKPDIYVNFVYYYYTDTASHYFKTNPGKTLDEIAQKEARSYNTGFGLFHSPQDIKKMVDVESEKYGSFFEIKYKNKRVILRTFGDVMYWPDENNIAAALKKLITTNPKLYFLCEEGGRSPFSERKEQFYSFANSLSRRFSLINQGYDSDTLSLKSDGIPTDATALVILDPILPFADQSIQKIMNFINAGGNLFLTVEPGRASLKPILDSIGVAVKDGQLLQQSDRHDADLITSYLTNQAKTLSPIFDKKLKDDFKYYGDSLFRVMMTGASPLLYTEIKNFKVFPLLLTDSHFVWNRKGLINRDSLRFELSKTSFDEQDAFATSLMLTRDVNGKQQRIFVNGDTDFPISEPWDIHNYNLPFAFWCFSSFSDGEFPPSVIKPETDQSFDIKVADIDKQRAMLIYIFPAFIGIAGSIVLIRRKRK